MVFLHFRGFTFFLYLLLFGYGEAVFSKTTHLYPFTAEADQLRFDRLINQTRCLVCKNQTIAESHTPLAQGLRKKIYTQIIAGYSDQAIRDYLVQRYGAFIFFEPPFNTLTYLLWIAPACLLALAVGLLFYILYRRQKN